MVPVPRDTPYMLNGSKVKINQAFAGRARRRCPRRQELTGVDVSYYADREFAGWLSSSTHRRHLRDVPHAIDYQVYTHDQAHACIWTPASSCSMASSVWRWRDPALTNTDQDAIRQSNIRAMVLALG